MLDTAIAYNKYKFLGNEFLTWLWYSISEHKLDMTLEIGAKLIMENDRNDTVERLAITGELASFDEALLSLKKGGMVAEMQLLYFNDQNQKWTFSLKGEALSFTGLKLPESALMQSMQQDENDTEAKILDRMDLIEKICAVLEDLFGRFIHLRVSAAWNQVALDIRGWADAKTR